MASSTWAVKGRRGMCLEAAWILDQSSESEERYTREAAQMGEFAATMGKQHVSDDDHTCGRWPHS